VPSEMIGPPRVKESHIHMECRLVQVVNVSARPLGGNIVIGEVVLFHVDDALISNYKIDPDVLRAIGRMGGPTYARTTDRFNMERPVAATLLAQRGKL
jgi:flavin reductase (DIM6/NTAB) family NADH-FMN oxidoreductase RutF